MPTKHLLIRAGITAINTLVIIAGLGLLATFGYMGWQYFANPQTAVQNQNGVLVTTTLRPTVRGFFTHAAFEWRTVKQAAAAEGGKLIEKYDSSLPVGPITTTVFDDEDISEPVPVDEEPTNTNGGTDTNSEPGDDQNRNENENVNATQDENSNQSAANENTNQPADPDANLNNNQNLNVPAEPSDDGNTNQGDGNTNTSDDVNQNVNTEPVNQNVNATENVNADVNVNAPANTNTETNTNQNVGPGQAEVISGDEWRRQIPRGRGFLQVNWFCSAAYTHLFLVKPDNTTLALGDFTGDCNNPAVVVTGMFLPQELPGVDLSAPLNFRLKTDWYDGAHITETIGDPELCTVDYIRGAGHRDVYAAQYTCDEGLGLGGAHDDLQFTVYAFPSSWTFPKDRSDLYTADELKADTDGDGFDLKGELKLGTNPNHWDTDTDNLGDFEEVEKYQTDPLVADTDGDGFKDYTEVNSQHNPLGSGNATEEQLAAWGVAPDQPGKPVITNVTAEYVGGSLVVGWDVAPAADGIVNFGPSESYGTYRNNTNFVTHHSISYPASPGQTVHYAIRSCTPAPNAACVTTNDAVYEIPE